MGLATAGAAFVALPGTASAATCDLGTPLGSCTTSGSANLTGGSLTMVAPPTLTWTGTASPLAQTLYDTSNVSGTEDEVLYAIDTRGDPAAGWSMSATATTFTGTTTGNTIPDTPPGTVLAVGGSETGAAGSPGSACANGTGTCVVPTNSITGYPLAVPTGVAATPTTIYDAAAATGTGVILIGHTATVTTGNPVVWSVALPGGLAADTYTSVITTTIATAP